MYLLILINTQINCKNQLAQLRFNYLIAYSNYKWLKVIVIGQKSSLKNKL